MAEESDPPRSRITKSSADPVGRGFIRGKHEYFTDERTHEPPVGTGNDEHPTPVDYFLSSLIACQASVLSQTLAKARIEDFEIDVTADIGDKIDADIVEDVPDKWFIETVDVEVTLSVPPEYEDRAQRCLDVYDQGCIVGQSMLRGVEYDPKTSLELVAR